MKFGRIQKYGIIKPIRGDAQPDAAADAGRPWSVLPDVIDPARLRSALRLYFIAMKTTMLMGGLALFTFWVGLSLGYHEGVNNERRAWVSTAQVERTGQGDPKIVYTFPRTRVSVNWLGQAPANRPDPRSYKKDGHFEP